MELTSFTTQHTPLFELERNNLQSLDSRFPTNLELHCEWKISTTIKLLNSGVSLEGEAMLQTHDSENVSLFEAIGLLSYPRGVRCVLTLERLSVAKNRNR